MHWVLIGIGIALGLYAAYGLFYYVTQDGMIFPADEADIPAGVEETIPERAEFWLASADGDSVEAWYLPPLPAPLDSASQAAADSAMAAPDLPTADLSTPPTLASPLVIVAHGNKDVIDDWPSRIAPLRAAGIGVLLVEYPGYGRSTGDPSQEDITATFAAAYDTVVARGLADTTQIAFMGHSLGGGVACQLATRRDSEALVLLSTFVSVESFAADYYLPGFLVRHPFDNLAVVRGYSKPILIMHAEDDGTVPYEHALALHDAAESGWFASRDRGGHETLRNEWPLFMRHTTIPFLAQAWGWE